jgi:hypothetical protein
MSLSTNTTESLTILWTTGDREVALKMLFMYAINGKSKGWWQHMRIIIWGPSAKLLSEDFELQLHVRKAVDLGIQMDACKACADLYGVSEKLEELGVTVDYMGQPLTALIREGGHLLTL